MSTVAVRASNRLADMLDWLESGTGMPKDGGHFIRVENYTDDGHGIIRAELPGVDPQQDIKLSVREDRLTISGERREEKHENHRTEFRYGSFSRSIPLPPGTDPEEVSATYRDGILEVRFPTSRPAGTPTEIPVQRPGD